MSEVCIEERENDTLSITVETPGFGATWTIRERQNGWQAVVATEGGSANHGPFESRDAALLHVLDSAEVLDDAE